MTLRASLLTFALSIHVVAIGCCDHSRVTYLRYSVGSATSGRFSSSERLLRYAIYYSPPADHPLTETAALWLGRDAFGAETAPAVGRERLVGEPARYGFHATLKAPFALKDGVAEGDLFAAFDRFADHQAAVHIGRLLLEQLGPFFALMPDGASHGGVATLADACVRTFEPFRAPLDAGAIARRKPDTLSEQQRCYLLEWGYPYVFEEFRFHMTLTGQMPEADRADIKNRLEMHFSSFLGTPLDVEHLALFAEPERNAPFHVIRMKRLSGRRLRQERLQT